MSVKTRAALSSRSGSHHPQPTHSPDVGDEPDVVHAQRALVLGVLHQPRAQLGERVGARVLGLAKALERDLVG